MAGVGEGLGGESKLQFWSGACATLETSLTRLGCSMAAVTLYTVIIKEGNLPKLLEVLLIVLIGGTSSCFCGYG